MVHSYDRFAPRRKGKPDVGWLAKYVRRLLRCHRTWSFFLVALIASEILRWSFSTYFGLVIARFAVLILFGLPADSIYLRQPGADWPSRPEMRWSRRVESLGPDVRYLPGRFAPVAGDFTEWAASLGIDIALLVVFGGVTILGGLLSVVPTWARSHGHLVDPPSFALAILMLCVFGAAWSASKILERKATDLAAHRPHETSARRGRSCLGAHGRPRRPAGALEAVAGLDPRFAVGQHHGWF